MKIKKDTIVYIVWENCSDAGICFPIYGGYTTAEHIDLAFREVNALEKEGKLPTRIEGYGIWTYDMDGERIPLREDDFNGFQLSEDPDMASGGEYLFDRKEEIPKEWFYPEE